MENTYSTNVSYALRLAQKLARIDNHNTFGIAHLVIALLEEPTGLPQILKTLNKDIDYIQDWFEMYREMYQPQPSLNQNETVADDQVKKILIEAEKSQLKLGTEFIDVNCIFSAIVRENIVYNKAQIEAIGVSEYELTQKKTDTKISIQIDNNTKSTAQNNTEIPFCQNFSNPENIEEGKKIIGRDKEIRNILENLERSKQKGILTIGDSGIGKTAVLKRLVHILHNNENPLHKEIPVFKLDIIKLLAASSNAIEIAKKLSESFEHISKINKQCILLIDDAHTLLEANQDQQNIINLLAWQVTQNNPFIILSSTNDAYRKYFEKHSINTKVETIFIEELDELSMLKAIENHKDRLEKHYNINIDDTSFETAITLSKRYSKESKLPQEALNLLDKTLASISLANTDSKSSIKSLKKDLINIDDNSEKSSKLWTEFLYKKIQDNISPVYLSKYETDITLEDNQSIEGQKELLQQYLEELEKLTQKPIDKLTSNEITITVADLTGIPIGKIQAKEKDRLLNIEQSLQERVKGQQHAINTLADAIIESRSGLSNPNQPIGSFFFLGPTGTGKTELTKSLAELLFDDQDAMIRFDMSEFKEEHSAALLYGAPPGYVGYEEGGMLVNKIRQKPYSVVLFDEIEKAHQSVYDVFLQILDEGKIHDKLGREGDFSNAIVIFTSNIGSQWISDQFSKGQTPQSNELIEIMTPHFRPEFLARLTEVVPFEPISLAVAQQIFELRLKRLQQQLLQQKEINLLISPNALTYLSQKGYSKQYGARPIAGVIRNYIKKAISRLIVSEGVIAKDHVLLHYNNEDLIWEKVTPSELPVYATTYIENQVTPEEIDNTAS